MPVGRDFMQSQWPGGKWITKGCCLVVICGTWRSKRVFLNLSYRGKGKSHKQEEPFMGHHKKTTQGVDHRTTLSGIINYFSLLWSKNIFALHSFLLKLISKEVWLNFFFWIHFYLHYWFFLSICKWQLNEHLLFLTLP